jgi:hypothetical protein
MGIAMAEPEMPTVSQMDAKLTDRDFSRLSTFIHSFAGIRLTPAKKIMLESRLRRRIRALGMSGYAEYCDFVLGHGKAEETVHLIDVVTTNKTDFFREPQHFDFLVQQALPTLMREYGAGQIAHLHGVERGMLQRRRTLHPGHGPGRVR